MYVKVHRPLAAFSHSTCRWTLEHHEYGSKIDILIVMRLVQTLALHEEINADISLHSANFQAPFFGINPFKDFRTLTVFCSVDHRLLQVQNVINDIIPQISTLFIYCINLYLCRAKPTIKFLQHVRILRKSNLKRQKCN